MEHETLWITQDVRTTATPRGGASAARVALARGGAPGAGIGELGVAVASGLAARWRRGPGPQARAGSPMPADRRAVHTIGAAVAAGSHRPWLRQQPLDLETHRRDHSGPLWGALSPRPCVAALAPLGLELSGARTPGPPTRRAGHCAREALHLARAKQKPADLGPISPSWMRVA